MTFGQKVRKLRENLGFNQIELAARLSVVNSTVSQWEADKRMPDSVMLQKLADFFEVSVDYLLGRTDSPTPQSPTASALPAWLSKLPPDMQRFVEEESKHGWPYLRLARGLKMQDLSKEELMVIVETWMDAKSRYEKDQRK